VTGPGPLDRLRHALAAAADAPAPGAIDGRVIGLGWATVELERAAVELGAALGLPAARFVDAPPTATQGARCRIARDVLPGRVAVVLLEPSTEGRLAQAWHATMSGRRLPGSASRAFGSRFDVPPRRNGDIGGRGRAVGA
jgi:hypothetical protein